MHTIRLRGPWKYHPATSAPSHQKTLKLPADWATVADPNATAPQPFTFRRTFQSPSGIEEGDSVILAIHDLPNAHVELNGSTVGQTEQSQSVQFAIGDHLQLRNELKVTLPLQADQPRPAEIEIVIKTTHDA